MNDMIEAARAALGFVEFCWRKVSMSEYAEERCAEVRNKLRAALAAAEAQPATKADRVHALVNAGHFPGMSEAFDAHMGAACWTDPAYAPDASTWAAAWKASKAQLVQEPLTREQIAKALAGAGLKADDYREDGLIEPLVWAIERAHGIGAAASRGEG